jgi:hypothetical protein
MVQAAIKLGISLTLAITFAVSADALATPVPPNEARALDWSVVTDSFGTAVDYPAAIFTSPAAPPRAAAEGLIHCIFISYPKSEKRAWDDVVTRMSLTLRVRR